MLSATITTSITTLKLSFFLVSLNAQYLDFGEQKALKYLQTQHEMHTELLPSNGQEGYKYSYDRCQKYVPTPSLSLDRPFDKENPVVMKVSTGALTRGLDNV